MTPVAEQSVIAVSQRLFLEQAAIDAMEEFYRKLLDQTPRVYAMGQFLFHVLTILETSAKGRCATPGLHECEQNHLAFLATPADAIRDRLLFASRLLSQLAVHTGAIAAGDAKELESQIEAGLRGYT